MQLKNRYFTILRERSLLSKTLLNKQIKIAFNNGNSNHFISQELDVNDIKCMTK